MPPRVVLVSGGARNIGRAITQRFAADGACVIFTDIGGEDGPALEQALRRTGGDAHFVRSDATDEAQVEALVASIVGDQGGLDIAVNNVGGVHPDEGKQRPLHLVSLAGWQGTIDLSLTAAFLGMKHQLAAMLALGRRGAIVNTASLAGLRVSPNSSPAYAAAKAALIHLTRKAAVTYAVNGIRVNAVAPGVVAPDVEHGGVADPRARAAEALHPNGRWVMPEEIAAAVFWLASDEAGSVTGHTLPIDGGWAAS